MLKIIEIEIINKKFTRSLLKGYVSPICLVELKEDYVWEFMYV